MPVILPTTKDLPAYSYRAPLEGVMYRFRFVWHDRPGAWYLDLATDAGVDIRSGIKLVTGWLLLRRLQHPSRPPGELFLAGPQDIAPTLESLGRTHFLYYLTVADQAGFAVAPAATDTVRIEAA